MISNEWIKDYFRENKKIGVFGIRYLDDVMCGILRNDFILIGARTGAGKTTISNMIALANAKLDKKVALFSLENFLGDNIVEKTYYYYKQFTSRYDISLREFISGEVILDEDKLNEAIKEAKIVYENINIINRDVDYNINKLKTKIIEEVNNGCDIIIIDHLDYINKIDEDISDISHISTIMKTLRDLQFYSDKKFAIIGISHLRKNNTLNKTSKIPSIDEFIGSSNKVKEATAVIMFAPDDEENYKQERKDFRNTWCCVRKLRMGGVDNTAANLIFNLRTGLFEEYYSIHKVNYSGNDTKPLKTVLPKKEIRND